MRGGVASHFVNTPSCPREGERTQDNEKKNVHGTTVLRCVVHLSSSIIEARFSRVSTGNLLYDSTSLSLCTCATERTHGI
jgi:hypothetical protein